MYEKIFLSANLLDSGISSEKNQDTLDTTNDISGAILNGF
jgi:hypothetical protein